MEVYIIKYKKTMNNPYNFEKSMYLQKKLLLVGVEPIEHF
jgi:hypothetical protein